MEIVGEDEGSVMRVEDASPIHVGRSHAFAADDPTVSRRHVLLSLQQTRPTALYIEVLGPNPILVLRNDGSGNAARSLLRKGQHLHLRSGDGFSLSLKKPHFFTVKEIPPCDEDKEKLRTDEHKGEETEREIAGNEYNDEKTGIGGVEDEESRMKEAVERRQRRALERKAKENDSFGKDDTSYDEAKSHLRVNRQEEEATREEGKEASRIHLDLDLEVDDADYGRQEQAARLGESLLKDFDVDPHLLSSIDPGSEFGFLVEGREFERYGKRASAKLDLSQWKDGEEAEEGSGDERLGKQRKGNFRKMSGKKRAQEEDEEWTAESEEERHQMNDVKKVSRSGGRVKKSEMESRSRRRSRRGVTDTAASVGHGFQKLPDNGDENDETLGGFIVEDSNVTEDEDDDSDEEEWPDEDDEDEEDD